MSVVERCWAKRKENKAKGYAAVFDTQPQKNNKLVKHYKPRKVSKGVIKKISLITASLASLWGKMYIM